MHCQGSLKWCCHSSIRQKKIVQTQLQEAPDCSDEHWEYHHLHIKGVSISPVISLKLISYKSLHITWIIDLSAKRAALASTTIFSFFLTLCDCRLVNQDSCPAEYVFYFDTARSTVNPPSKGDQTFKINFCKNSLWKYHKQPRDFSGLTLADQISYNLFGDTVLNVILSFMDQV